MRKSADDVTARSLGGFALAFYALRVAEGYSQAQSAAKSVLSEDARKNVEAFLDRLPWFGWLAIAIFFFTYPFWVHRVRDYIAARWRYRSRFAINILAVAEANQPEGGVTITEAMLADKTYMMTQFEIINRGDPSVVRSIEISAMDEHGRPLSPLILQRYSSATPSIKSIHTVQQERIEKGTSVAVEVVAVMELPSFFHVDEKPVTVVVEDAYGKKRRAIYAGP